jgi:hypothetical protein
MSEVVSNLVGIGTYIETCSQTGIYDCNVQVQILPGSSLTVQIKHGNTSLITSAAPGANQTHIECSAVAINCAANDTISVILASAAAQDATATGIAVCGPRCPLV